MGLAKLFSQPVGFLRAPQSPDILSRRNLLMGGSALAAFLNSREPAQAAPPPSNTRFLVNRLGYGWNQQEQQLADQLGYYGYLEYQLNHTAIDDSALDQRMAAYYFLNWQPFQLMGVPQPSYLVHQLVEGNFIRAAFSNRQLYQRMAEFWTDHFNIDINNSLNPWLKIIDDKQVVRPNALGMFGDMLLASAKSTSMSMYLNNDTSVVGNQNENYARELMELHTLGVDGGYTQQDVVEVARCLTGWAYYGTDSGVNMMTFGYFDYKHDQGSKVVLGHQIPANGGMNDGLIVLDILLHHPSTAKFIAKKLCRMFHSYSPPQSLIDSVAATFTATTGDIKACIRTLFSSIDPATTPAKFKRPYHLIVSAFRATGANIVDNAVGQNSELRDQMASSGHPPYSWMTPDGYPDKLDFWANMLLPRWNFATLLGGGILTGVTFDVNAFYAGAADPNAMTERINQSMFGGLMPANDQTQIRNYLSVNPTNYSRQREAVGLAIASPAFQWY
jgi:uncharacterized protein (DUF1800 family)